jgi:hypothetical protein
MPVQVSSMSTCVVSPQIEKAALKEEGERLSGELGGLGGTEAELARAVRAAEATGSPVLGGAHARWSRRGVAC